MPKAHCNNELLQLQVDRSAHMQITKQDSDVIQ